MKKAQLVNLTEITNEIILQGTLVGVIDLERPNIVNVAKNTINNVQGEIPLTMWMQLVEDLENKIAKEEVDSTATVEEELEEVLEDLFYFFKNSKEDIKKTATKLKSDIISKETVKHLEMTFKKVFSEMFENSMSSEDIKKEIIKYLENFRDDAISMGVATKCFIKKINEKIISIR